jgi:hypothetical protein
MVLGIVASTSQHPLLAPAVPQQGLQVQVGRDKDQFISSLCALFPHEAHGIQSFYSACWDIFTCLNSLELKSLEEPLYLMHQLLRDPGACLKLASYLTANTGAGAGDTTCRLCKIGGRSFGCMSIHLFLPVVLCHHHP